MKKADVPLLVLSSIEEVAARQLCCGCGICAALEPERYSMVDDIEQGRRPMAIGGAAPSGDALRACPGIALSHEPNVLGQSGNIRSLLPAWGPVLEVWEGYAADDEIRFAGSSGGAASAIALCMLESGSAQGVVHISQHSDVPYLNETVISKTSEELLARTGSRYAPASPCDALGEVVASGEPHVFIGKPCDVAALAQAQRFKPEWDAAISLRIAFFCAGTPSTAGTLEMLRRMGVEDPKSVRSIRYRGNGWPGLATVIYEDERGQTRTSTMTYEKSWGDILTNHKPWRCNICPDHSGEFADIAVGDPWYREIEEGEPGRSLILVRTVRGRDVLMGAIESGHLVAQRASPEILPASQANLLTVRGAVWGRLLAMRLRRVPAPRYTGMPMFGIWVKQLSMKEKVRSIVGTIRRMKKRGLYRSRVVMPHEASGTIGVTPEAGE